MYRQRSRVVLLAGVIGFVGVVGLAGCGSASSTKDGASTSARRSAGVAVEAFRPVGADEMAAVDAAGPNLVGIGFMWSDAPVRVSTDGGHTWRAATVPGLSGNSSLSPQLVGGTAFLVGSSKNTPFGTPPMIWRSTDHGRTYAASRGVAPPDSVGAVIGIDEVDDRLVAFGYGGSEPGPQSLTRWESTDEGATWTRVPIDGVEARGAFLQPPVVTPQGALLATTSDGVLRSTDAGATWTAVKIRAPHVERPPTPMVVDGQVFLSGPGGVWSSADDGATWTERGAPPVVPAGTDDPEWSSIRVTNARGGTIAGVLTSFIDNDEQFDHLVWADPDTSAWHLADVPHECGRHPGESGADSTISGPVETGGMLFATANCAGRGAPGAHLLESADQGRSWQARAVALPASLQRKNVRFSPPVVLEDGTVVFTVARNLEQATDAVVRVRVRVSSD